MTARFRPRLSKTAHRLLLGGSLIIFSILTLILDLAFVPHWWELWPVLTLAAGIFVLRSLLPKRFQR